MFEYYFDGFAISFVLMITASIQNAHIIKLGILRQHLLKTILFFTFADMAVMGLSVWGLNFVLKQNQIIINILGTLGVFLLLGYAFVSFKNVFKKKRFEVDEKGEIIPIKELVSMLLLCTFFNPNMYRTMPFIVASVGINVPQGLKLVFLFGCVCALFVWFSLLGYGAKHLTPVFKKRYMWRIFDVLIGLMMLVLAYDMIKIIRAE